ncbi:Adenylyl-sulfate kinase 1, chloroplastic [Stylosanthes scabra]|uniref:Adenylyl-sulfate kinase n=1 Tax=Stylosanthes scabra TaxID=79078 RepID=A0ABU6ZAB1_9FABA|nr:Adenylyl-sulfate kinase 1, chloroplastic [Stylosanthes scabra]
MSGTGTASAGAGNFCPLLRLKTTSRIPKLGFLKLNHSLITFRSLQIKASDSSNHLRLNVAHDVTLSNANGHATGSGTNLKQLSTIGNSTNIQWHNCSVLKDDRHRLLDQKGCVIWITGLSGSGKSTVACALSRILHQWGKLTYVLDGDNLRHGLNKDLGFKAQDRAENIRRFGEVGKLFADAGVICIASLISPYRRDRDACRAMLANGDFIEVFMDVPLHVCEARDPKGLYKLARAGKIKGFTGIDDPYETPIHSEIVLKHGEPCASSPVEMAEKIAVYLENNGYLHA